MDMAILMANTEYLFAFQRQEEQKNSKKKYRNIKFPPFLGMASFICCWLYSWNNLYIFLILCFIYPRDSTLLLLLIAFHIHFILCLLVAFCLIILSFFLVCCCCCYRCWHKIFKRLSCINNLTIRFISISFNNNTRNNRFCITWESLKL